jgi:hypothetical protein
MPNQFKCNNIGADPTEKINSFNAVYDHYYDNVIKNPNNAMINFDPTPIPKVNGQSWSSIYCDAQGCPSNFSTDSIAQSSFFIDVDRTNVSIKNRDLARYLNDCASKITLDKNASPYYGGVGNNYNNTITLRDISYNTLLTDRSDLDRKMKEVLALQGSMVNEHQNYVDGSVYTTLLWTVMATSLIYYVFTKI